MKILPDTKLDFSDVLILPKRSTLTSRSEPEIIRKFTFKNGETLECLPVICSNMDTIGNFVMAKKLMEYRMLTILHKHYSVKELEDFYASNSSLRDYVGISFGITDKDLLKIKECNKNIDFKILCIDVANGYSQNFIQKVAEIRKLYPKKILMAGNVCTGDLTSELIISSGVDIVKAGIGGGSVCTTRIVAGIGMPQLSCVLECSDVAHGNSAQLCSDGGAVTVGNINTGFGAGADFMMLGGMFAGTDESSGEIIEKEGKKYKRFYGMASREAQNKYSGGVSHYKAPEGKSVDILYKGSADQVCQKIIGGLRSCMTYIGAVKLKDIPKCTTFIRVNNQYNTSLNVYQV
jgi:GMP reductase